MDYKDSYVTVCPFCGQSEMIEVYQDAYAAVTAVGNIWSVHRLWHTVCRNCGSVVRSFVKNPEKLLKKRDRKPDIRR